MQFNNTPGQNNSLTNVSTQLNISANLSSGSIDESWLSEHTLLSGQLTAEWESSAWVGTHFTYLSIANAEVYDEQDNLIGTGTVVAQSSDDYLTSLAIVLGDTVSYHLDVDELCGQRG